MPLENRRETRCPTLRADADPQPDLISRERFVALGAGQECDGGDKPLNLALGPYIAQEAFNLPVFRAVQNPFCSAKPSDFRPYLPDRIQSNWPKDFDRLPIKSKFPRKSILRLVEAFLLNQLGCRNNFVVALKEDEGAGSRVDSDLFVPKEAFIRDRQIMKEILLLQVADRFARRSPPEYGAQFHRHYLN